MDTAPFMLEITQDAPAVFHAPSCSGSLDLRLGDCMEGMKTFPDGYFDLAIVDPPYGIGEDGGKFRGRKGQGHRVLPKKGWDKEPPPPEYFEELRRVSKNQIIWGGNYFPLPPSRCWLFWDKLMGGDFADGELAWTSLDRVVKKFTKCNKDHGHIHPTQKPVALYKWTLANFAAPGMRVLDTHMGSGSIAIAAHYAGIHLTAYEIDPDYYHAAKARIARETSQAELFSPQNQRAEPQTSQGESVGSSESSKSMNPHYHFDLMVECPDGTRRRAAFKIDAFEAPFEKYDLCSTPLAAMMAGGVMKMGAARIDSDRKRLAQQIAEQLTKTILDAVQSRDLVNGYPKE